MPRIHKQYYTLGLSTRTFSELASMLSTMEDTAIIRDREEVTNWPANRHRPFFQRAFEVHLKHGHVLVVFDRNLQEMYDTTEYRRNDIFNSTTVTQQATATPFVSSRVYNDILGLRDAQQFYQATTPEIAPNESLLRRR